MTDTTHTPTDPCQHFRDNLDLWLARELDDQQQSFMQAHQDVCPDCAMEARLAREIDVITQALPPLEYPQRQLPKAARVPVAKSVPAAHGLFAKLIATWRQPLVFGPAMALILVSGVLIQMQFSSHPVEPQVIVVNGQEYTPEEVIQAAEDLELALQYLSKYSNFAARAVSSELRDNNPPVSSPTDDFNDPAI